MISKSKIKKFILIVLIISYSVELVKGEEMSLSPDGSNSNQDMINTALEKGDVYLEKGVYEITGPIYVPRNVNFLGDSEAIIKVSSEISSPWFSPKIGVVNCFDPINIKIRGFEIDGNCQNLPNKWANSREDTAHDCEQLIKVIGSSGNYGENIEISNMALHNSFGDGIQARCIDGIVCKDNTIINTQHESIYYSACKNCKMVSNKMAVITSDGGRFDNCINGEAENNIVWQYNGTNDNGAWKGGANGFQIGDAGSSHGYDARKKNIHTTNVEIHNNTIIDPGREAIVIDAAGLTPSTNVYVHDNVVVGTEELETMGISVEDISSENPPTVGQSEKVFSSIFDILNTPFFDTGRIEQTADDIHIYVAETEKGRITGGIKIIGFKDLILLDGVQYIPDNKSVLVKSIAFQTPFDTWFNGGVSNITKDVDVSIQDGEAKATLTVKLTWFTVKTDSTGKKIKKYHTSKAVFNDSCQAPEILQRERTTKAYVNVFEDTKNPITRVRAGHTNTTQKIEFTYGETTTTHKFMVGERLTNETGLQSTIYSQCDVWEGSIPHMGNELLLVGKFDPAKLHIKYYTPYESSEIEDIKIMYHKTEGENPVMETLKFIIQFIFAIYAGYKIMDTAIN